MSGITAALVAALASTSPLPDGKSFDTLTFSFSPDGIGIGPVGSLGVAANGKVWYFHSTAPHTGSGGRITSKDWEITKDQAAALFQRLVADGLFDIPEPKLPGRKYLFQVTSGRWQLHLATDTLPYNLLDHLRPLLAKAHPVLWGLKPKKPDGQNRPLEEWELPKQPPEKPIVVEKPRLTSIRYSFTAKVHGEEATLTVNRDGNITYWRQTHPTAPGGQKVIVKEAWKIDAKDAAAILDSLLADGLFELANTLGGKFPNHYVEARAGRWQRTFFPKELPEKLSKHVLPLLQKADREVWK